MSIASSSVGQNNRDYKKFLAIKAEIQRMSSKSSHTKQNSVPSIPKKSISIILYAYKVADYIEVCLDSIQNQTEFINNNNYEIIIGVDDCQETRIKLHKIKNKYKNLNLYETSNHLGKYVTLNTLLDKAKFNNILCFDAEDIMKLNMIEEALKYTDEYDIVKFNYDYFDEETTNIIKKKYWFNEGIFLFNNKVLKLAGGYKNWVYGADVELYERVYNFVKVKELEDTLFYKRQKDEDAKLSRAQKLKSAYTEKIRRYKTDENIRIDKVVEIKPVITQKTDVNLSKNVINEPISIVIAAYKAQDFIEECLDSIENQTYFKNNDYEILVGVDGCYDTLYKLQEISHKYKNLRIFMMKDNKGTYVTFNTLIDLIKYENILRFDADDVMMPSMIEQIMVNSSTADVIRYGFTDFKDNINITNRTITSTAWGAIFMKKSVIDLAGGFQSWRCSGDYEFIKRIENNVKIVQINKPLFYRRNHENSLSNKSDTSLSSSLRREYNTIVRNYRYKRPSIKIDKVVNEYEEIRVIHKNDISIIVTAWQTQDYIEECLDSIENQTYFKNNKNFEVLVGVDGCEATLNKLKEIRHKYRNLRIFMMDSNMGTYVTSNTLLDLVKYKNILRFDSDDVMKPEMIEKVILYCDKADVIRFGYSLFKKTIFDASDENFHLPHGVVLYNKKVFDIAGGYQNWLCAADSELLERIKNNVEIKELYERLFYRRKHGNSLTQRVETRFGSDIRKKYAMQVRHFNQLKINKKINGYTEY